LQFTYTLSSEKEVLIKIPHIQGALDRECTRGSLRENVVSEQSRQRRREEDEKQSFVLMLLALIIFGFVKGRFAGAPALHSALQTIFIGGLAATAALLIAWVIG
jgi:hypothetical protein